MPLKQLLWAQIIFKVCGILKEILWLCYMKADIFISVSYYLPNYDFSPLFCHCFGIWGKRSPWCWRQNEDIDREGIVSVLWSDVLLAVHPQPQVTFFTVTQVHFWACTLLWQDLFSFQNRMPGLLFFPFTSSLTSPSTHHPSCKSHFFHWTFYFVPPSRNYCLAITLSIHINLTFVIS